MKNITKAAVIATMLTIGAGAAAPAFAEGFAFSFNPAGVEFAYRDGYWDHYHHWHAWRNAREAREFRARYHDRYYDWRHTRDHDHGWRR